MQSSFTYRTNRDLFSNYYLDEHLPETEEWNEVDDDELEAAYDEIVALYDREKSTAPKRNESQLEEKFIRPMFRKLGIPFEVEESTSRTQRRPDYGFFETEDAARDAFERREGGGDFYENAVAVADAKRWGRPLDTRGSGEHKRDFENPSYQIHVYLQETPARWAVLTDGKKWRLYYGPTSHRLDSYYEVDLPTVLEKGDMEDFKYFYLFFRHGAFLEDAGGDCFLDDVYDESNVFAQDLGEDLQDNIYEAIKILSEGYLQYPDNDLDEDDLDLVHDSSLIYLYRLIFVLYAEAEGRDLLDTDNEIYEQSYSLNSLKQEVAEELDSDDPKYRDWQDDLSSRLDELYELIDQGSKSRGIPKEDLHIPAYNGGLFRTDPDEDDDPEARFLAKHTVGDAYLARVIELLTRSKQGSSGGKIFVDYSSLDVRHLGSIYEGLLEYQLHVADGPLALEDDEYVEAEEDDEVAVEEGEVYLTTGSGERKATGSYYTPEYVVEYIVDETLGPLVDDIREDLVGYDSYSEGGFAEEFAERIFELKILDPAMGSGHFLTSAVDYLAREIIDAQERQAAQQGIETVEEDHDINWARRKVAQRCIYGVDLNPLATELAKVSLWLRTLAAEQPLAFLDHHLKTGNSLVGSDIEDVLANGDDSEAGDGQLTLEQSFAHTRQQALEHVMERFEDLLSIDNETLEDAKEMEDVYDAVRDDPLYRHLLAMANVHTAKRFGLDVPSDADQRMAGALRSDSWSSIEGQDWFESAQAMASEERFFHWELEFPVAFYSVDGERVKGGGFDAVIGNPPYVRQEKLAQIKEYVKSEYSVYDGKADIYSYFFELSLSKTRNNGRIGYISSNRFITAEYGSRLRDYISENSHMKQIVDFNDQPVFPGVTTYPAIFVFQNTSKRGSIEYSEINTLEFEDLQDYVRENTSTLPEKNLSGAEWKLRSAEINSLLDKLEDLEPLGEYLTEEINRGVVTGLNDAFIISEEKKQELISKDQKSKEIIKPIISGSEIRRYYNEEVNEYLIFSRRGIEINEYPEIKRYLNQYKDRLKPEPPSNSGSWDGRKPGDYKWYEIQDTVDYWEDFESNKIIYPEVSKDVRFTIDDTKIYPNKTAFLISDDDYHLLSILNSNVCKLYLHEVSSRMRGGYYMNSKIYVQQIPIPDQNEVSYPQHKIPFDIDRLSTHTDVTIGGDKIVFESLTPLSKEMVKLCNQKERTNLNLLDYLGNYVDGPDLPDIGAFQPTGSNILDATTEEYEKLRVGDVRTERDGGTVTISMTARYKPEDEDAHETDTYGYTETKFHETFTLMNLSEQEAELVEAFVPIAVDKKMAGFRDNATKTNSLVDRLKAITLPDPDDVADDLRRYVETKERADELDAKIEETDRLIDEIVYDLYDLTDEEIEIVESAVADD
ncbi:Eco57I restriction-modification methylase domain-containing protein [Halorubrum sp. FL23]|uniref:Eco57I restriction-modification methylase domain-containing protein n=1 Tax=Halorubrum sp. FL23 TaxID=3458704 RepID=UPI00403403A2